jgi:hypothetical protein
VCPLLGLFRQGHDAVGRSQRWLAGEFDAAVDLPVAVVCVVLNMDATALAAAVRKRARP